MKIALSIELDIPDDVGMSNYSCAEIEQLLFDSYVYYTTRQHSQEATKWCARAKLGSETEDASGRLLYNYHNTWADICNAAKWDYKIIANNA